MAVTCTDSLTQLWFQWYSYMMSHWGKCSGCGLDVCIEVCDRVFCVLFIQLVAVDPVIFWGLEACGTHLIHQCLGWSHSAPKTIARSLDALLHNYVTKNLLVTMGCSNSPTKTAPSPSTITTPSNTPIPRLTPLTIPNIIRIRLDRETDRQMV